MAARLAPLVCVGLPIADAHGANGGLPSGGAVVSGAATIGTPGNGSLTINQSSQRAIVNWKDFSIGGSGTVTIQQPGANAAILNRVDGGKPSVIAGDLKANGQVFLVNPNGIAITPSGSVNVGGGFVASTLGITNQDFNAGRLNFSGNGASASVSNGGTIRTAPGGFVGLLGGQVSQSGVIVAPVGKVGIGAGEQATLDLNGNGFLQVVTPTDPNGRSGALIDVSGKVIVPGGRVEIKAAAAQRAIHEVVNLPGSVSASAAHREGGVIVLDGGDGSTRISGSVAATSQTAAGGTVAIRGRDVVLSGARVTASGATGGGRVAIRASPPVGAAGPATITVDAATSIKADAWRSGDGGAVSIIGNVTHFAGHISAQALGETGNGGSAEVSGGRLDYVGTTTLLSRHGTTGTLLLDPYNVTISTGADANATGFTATATGATINTTTLQNALATANVNVTTGSSGSETGNITVANPVSWTANTTLTLTAAGGVVLNAGITNSGASSGLTLIANGTGGISGAGALANSGSLTLNVANAGGTGTLSGVISGAGSLTKLGSGTVSLSGANTYSGGTTVSAGTLVATVNAAQTPIGTGAASISSGAVLKLDNTATSDITIGNSFTGAGQLNLNFNNSNASNTIMNGAFGMSGQILLSTSTVTGNKWTAINQTATTAAALTINAGTTFFASGGAPTFTGGITVSGTGNNENFGALRVESGTVLGGNIQLLTSSRIGMANTGAGTILGNISSGVAGPVTLTTATNGKTVTLAGALSNGLGTLSFTVGQAGTTQLTGANTYTGATTISAGTLQVGGAGSLGTGSYAGAISLASGATLEYSSSAAQTLSGVVSGAGQLLKDTTASTLTLTAANTYTGTTSVSAGTLKAGSTSAFGSLSATTLSSGGTLDLNGYSLTIGSLAGTGGMVTDGNATAATLTTGGNNGTTSLAGILQNGAGTLSLVKIGTGAQTLSGINTYTGATTVSTGILQIGGAGSLGSGSYVAPLTVASGATFTYSSSANQTLSALAAGTGTINLNGSGVATISGNQAFTGTLNVSQTTSLTGTSNAPTSGLNHAAAINVTGASLTLDTGDNSFVGALPGSTVLTLNAGGSLLANANYTTHLPAVVLNGGTLGMSGTLGANGVNYGVYNFDKGVTATASSVISASDVVLTQSGGTNFVISPGVTVTFSGYTFHAPSSPDNGLNISGGGTLLMTGTNTSTSGIAINAGTLQVGNTGSLGAGNYAGAISIASGATFEYSSSAAQTLSGILSGAGVVAKDTATSVLTLTGTNTYNGSTTVAAGTLQIGSAGSLGAGTYAGAISITSGAAFRYSSSAAQTLSGILSGAGVIAKDTATSNLILTGTNTYTGSTTVSAGTLQIGSAGSLGSGSYAGPISLASGGTLEYSSSATQILSGIVSGAGQLAKDTSASTLTLTAANTYTGSTSVSAGTLKAGSTSALGSLSAATLSTGGTLDLNGNSLTIGSLAGTGGTVTNGFPTPATLTAGGNNGTASFTGVIQNGNSTVSLTKGGTGVQTLAGANTYTGATTVSSGTLTLSGSWNVGAGTATTAVASGATLNGAGTLTAATLQDSGAGTVSLTGANAINATTTSGTIGAFTLNDAQSVSLGSMTSSGVISITTTGASSDITIGSGSTLTTSGSAMTLTASRSVNDSGTIITGGGNLAISAPTSGSAVAISLAGAAINVGAGTGTISGTSTNNFGLDVSGSSTLTASTGSLTLNGQTGTPSVSFGAGLDLQANASLTTSGAVGLIGGASGSGHGVSLQSGASFVSGGSLSLGGTSGAAVANRYGVYLVGGNSITANSGSVTVTGSAASGNGVQANAVSLINNGASSFTVSGTSSSGTGFNVASSASVSTSGPVSLSGGSTSGTDWVLNGGNTIGNGAGALTLTATGTSGFKDASTVTFNTASGATTTVNGAIVSTGGLALTGAGLLTLNSVNTFSGATAIGGGTLAIGSGGSLGGGSYGGAISIASGATLRYSSSAAQVLSGAISGAGQVTKDTSAASTLTLSGPDTYAGATTVGAGTLTLSGSLNVGSSATMTTVVASGATLNGAGTLTAGTLSTSGAGTLSLTGANAIGVLATSGTVGALTLNNAQSIAVGSIASTGAILVAASGTTADLTLSSGATLSTPAIGNAITLVAGRNFINGAGSAALSTSGGRWLVYSADPAADTFGALNSNNRAVWNQTYATLPPASVAQAGNGYVFAYQPTITFSSTSSSKVYGADSTTAVAAQYIASSPQMGVPGIFLADTNATAFSGAPVVTSPGSAASAGVAGSPYAVMVSAGSLAPLNGYVLAYASPGTLSVSPAALTVTARDAAKTYDGLGFSGGNGVSYAGLVNGETAAVLGGNLAYGGTAQGAVNAGSYSLTASGITSANYTIAYVPGTLSVSPAALTVTARDAAKTYDGLGYSGGNGVTYAGLVNGETASVLGGSVAYGGTAQGAVNAGSYSLTASGLTSSNYTIAYAPGTLSVSPAALTVTARDAAKTYDGLGYSGGNGVTYAGLVNGETASVLGGSVAYGGTAQGAVNAGSYSLTASGLTSANYTIAYAPGALSVSPAALTVTARDAAKTYDGLGYSGGNGVTYAGLVNGETASVLGGSVAYGGTSQGAVNAGSYSLTASGITSANYTIAYVPGTLSVSPAALTVTARDAAKTYDGLGYSGGNGVTYAGLVNGETASVLGGSVAYGGTAQGAVNAGSYSLTASGLTSSNYTIAYAPGTLSVSPAALTVTARDAAKTYDGLGYSGGNGVTYAGLVNGETASVLGGSVAYGGTAQGAVNAGSYSLTASGITSANYTIAYVPGTLSVSPAVLTVTARDAAKTYDGLGYSGGNGVTYAGLVNGETASVLGGSVAYGGTAQGAVNAGSYSLTASGLTSSNYTIAYAAGALSVSPAALTVTARDAAKTYDGLGFSGGNGVLYAGLVNGETASVLGGNLAYGGTAQGAVNAGSYGLIASGLTAPNYAIAYAPGTLSVSPAALTVTARDAAKTYDGLGYSGGNGVTYAGLVNGETSAVLGGNLAYRGTAQGAVNTGSYGLIASGLTAPNYAIAYMPGTLSVSPAALAVTARDAAKTYDGLSFSGGNGATYAGLVNGETAAVLGGNLAFGGTAQGAVNAGSYSLTASGLTASNYTIAYAPGALSVSPAALTVTARDAAKTYDGLGFSGNGVSYAGLVNGETAAVLGGNLAFGGTAQGAVNAGSYSLTASGLTASNYSIAYAPGALSVSPAALTVTARDAAKTYDGLGYGGGNGVTYAGLVNGETAAVLGGSVAYGGTAQGAVNAGSYSLTPSGLTSSNYTIAYAPGTLSVSAAALTVTARDATKTYDGLGYTGGNGVTYAGLVNGETSTVLGGNLAYGGTAQGAVDAGSYSLTASGLTSSNYTIAYAPGALSVSPAALTVTARDAARTYDGLGYSGGNGVTYAGLVNSETASVLGGSVAYGGTAQGAVSAGSYSLTASGLTSSNYTIAYAPGTLNVSPAALTVTARDATKIYDGLGFSGGNGVTYAGLVNGETASVLGGSLAYGGTAQGAVNAGSYSLTASGLTASNYTIAYAPGTLNVSPAALTVTARDAAKTYDGLSYTGGHGVTYAGLVNGETASVLGGSIAYGGTAQGAVNAGSYSLTASGMTSANYTIAYVPGTLNVSPAALTVTARDAAKTYDGLGFGGGNGVSYAGLVNGETAAVLGGSVAYGGTAQGAISAGSYSLTASGLTSSNYTIAYAPGTLNVSPAALTVTARDAAKTYDGLGFSGGNGVLYAGLVNGETSAVLGGNLAYGGTAQGAVNAGSYSLTPSGLTSSNYTIAYAPGTLSISPAALTVTARDAAKIYDGLGFSGGNSVSYAGLVNGETPAVLGGSVTYGGAAQSAINAGKYSLTASGLTSSNYTIAYVPGTLSVSPAALTVTARDAAKTYDGLGYTGGNGVLYAGLVNGETASVVGGNLAYGGTAQGAVNAGIYSLTALGLSSSDYSISYAPGTLRVSASSVSTQLKGALPIIFSSHYTPAFTRSLAILFSELWATIGLAPFGQIQRSDVNLGLPQLPVLPLVDEFTCRGLTLSNVRCTP